MRVELIKRIKETRDTFSFIFKPEKEIYWKAGQFVFYRIPHRNPDSRGIERHFTISSAPHEKNIMLTTRFDFKKGSSFKRALYNLEPGSIVEASDIQGDFTIKSEDKKFVFIAGGIGVTPYRSIMLDLAHRGRGPDITVLYGNKNMDIVFKDVLDGLAASNDWLDLNYIIEPRLIDSDVIKRSVSDIFNSVYYTSGPRKMVEIIVKTLLEMNLKEENMIVDYFPGYGD